MTRPGNSNTVEIYLVYSISCTQRFHYVKNPDTALTYSQCKAVTDSLKMRNKGRGVGLNVAFHDGTRTFTFVTAKRLAITFHEV